jgi:hypothetical protein
MVVICFREPTCNRSIVRLCSPVKTEGFWQRYGASSWWTQSESSIKMLLYSVLHCWVIYIYLFSTLYNDALIISDCGPIATNDSMIANTEVEIMCKEAAVTYVNLLSWNLRTETEQNHKKHHSAYSVSGYCPSRTCQTTSNSDNVWANFLSCELWILLINEPRRDERA